MIRRAAARATQTLATRQLKSPSPQTELQLWRVATSTYRLMDPRKRSDSQQSAFIGRIMPNTLTNAGYTRFAAGVFNGQQSNEDAWANTTDDSDELSVLDLDEPLITLSHGMELDNDLERTLNSNDLLERGVLHRVYLRAKTTLSQRRLSIASSAAAVFFVATVARYAVDQKVTDLPATIAAVDKSLSRPTLQGTAQRSMLDSTRPLVAAVSTDTVIMDAFQSTVTIEPRETLLSPDSNLPKSTITSIPVTNIHPELRPNAVSMPRPADLAAARVTATPSFPEISFPGIPEVDEGAIAANKSVYLDDPFADLETPLANTIKNAVSTLLPESPVILPASTVRVNNRKPVPSDAVIAKCEQELFNRIEPLRHPLPIELVDGVLASLSDIANASDTSLPEHWSARLLAARTAWLTGEVEQVQQFLRPLSDSFDVGMEQLTAESYVNAVAFREDGPAHLHRIKQGFRLYDYLLRNEQFDLTDRVDHEIQQSVDFLDDESQRTTLRTFRLAAEQMTRIKSNATVIINQPIGELIANATEPSSVTPSQAGVAGRYLCLMQRRWDLGLNWLAAGSDTRLAPLAKQELSLDAASTTADERIQVAQRWLAVAQRGDDRTSESILRHSLDLFRSAMESADQIQKIELERSITEIEAKLPDYLTNPVSAADSIASEPAATDKPTDSTSERTDQSAPDVLETLPTMLPVPDEKPILTDPSTPKMQEPEQRDDVNFDRRRGISIRLGRDKANMPLESFAVPVANEMQSLFGHIQRRHRNAF
ncbi:MAG: hypothetical protein WBD20_15290 [Pirellulaceae bacterium]